MTHDPITTISHQAMRDFADAAARADMLPLSDSAITAAVESLRAEILALLTDPEIRSAVESGNGTIPAFAYRAAIGAALASAAKLGG